METPKWVPPSGCPLNSPAAPKSTLDPNSRGFAPCFPLPREGGAPHPTEPTFVGLFANTPKLGCTPPYLFFSLSLTLFSLLIKLFSKKLLYLQSGLPTKQWAPPKYFPSTPH